MHRSLLKALSLAILILSGCAAAITPEPPPGLVTLPAASRVPATDTPPPTLTPATAVALFTAEPSQAVIPTVPPQPAQLAATRPLWEWSETARPTAMSASDERVGAIVADGRFVWLDPQTGRTTASGPLWKDVPKGDSWGGIYAEGSLAIIAARETSINEITGLPGGRSRVVVYDGQAGEVWALPETSYPQFYTVSITQELVLVGKGPFGAEDNSLAAYELFNGSQQWQNLEPGVAYHRIVHDDLRMYAITETAEGGSISSYDWRSGDRVWRWSDPAVIRPDDLALDGDTLYVLTVQEVLALDSLTGTLRWRVALQTQPEAGFGVRNGKLFLAPAPTAELGFRPGIVSLDGRTGELRWHALLGWVADPFVVSDAAVWALLRDYDSGRVYMAALNPETGVEEIRLAATGDPPADDLYRLEARGRRAFVLGDSLWAYGF